MLENMLFLKYRAPSDHVSNKSLNVEKLKKGEHAVLEVTV